MFYLYNSLIKRKIDNFWLFFQNIQTIYLWFLSIFIFSDAFKIKNLEINSDAFNSFLKCKFTSIGFKSRNTLSVHSTGISYLQNLSLSLHQIISPCNVIIEQFFFFFAIYRARQIDYFIFPMRSRCISPMIESCISCKFFYYLKH